MCILFDLPSMETDDLTRIESTEEAIGVAITWAHEHDLASRDFRKFAEEWFVKSPPDRRVRINLRATLRSFASVCKHYETEWGRNTDLLADLTSNWNLETVKHLAVFNVAGLAGAAALLTNANYANQVTTKLALPCFAVGLICALFTFWTNMRGYALAYQHADTQRRTAAYAREWKDVERFLKEYEGKFKSEDWFDLAELTGWLSAASGVAGVVGLAVSLL
jgi:hypothetical protein